MTTKKPDTPKPTDKPAKPDTSERAKALTMGQHKEKNDG